MKIKKSMWEVILIILSGIVTIGLSVNAVIKNSNQEKETEKYQKESKSLQDNLNKKTDEIIELNRQLKNQADSHAIELRKLTKPVPKKVSIHTSCKLKLNEKELQAFIDFFEPQKDKIGNVFNDATCKRNNIIAPTIESLSNSSINILFKINGANEKKIEYKYTQFPIKLIESVPTKESFLLSYDYKSQSIHFDGDLTPNDFISTSHTLYDFEEFEAEVLFQFGNPISIDNQTFYTIDSNKNIALEINNLFISFEEINLSIELKNFKEHNFNSFSTSGKLNLA